ncbi:MAG: hypothetical protein ACYC27_15315 [Armatimonadota bacterium]
MSDKASFRYSAQEGVLELEGSEDFITKHFDSLTDIVRVMARRTIVDQYKEVPTELSSQSMPLESSSLDAKSAESIEGYPEVYQEINDKLKITAEIPGDSKKAQMTNAALLFCYGAKLMGDEQVSSREIREVCEEHGILDDGNFSRIFGEKSLFLSDGIKGGTKEIKLTFQGCKRAKELLASA